MQKNSDAKWETLVVRKVCVQDVRFPTAKEQQGTDAVHINCNYSAGYVSIHAEDTSGALENPPVGHGIVFTIGKGNEVCAQCVDLLAEVIVGHSVHEITTNFAAFFHKLTNEPQLRWIGPEKGAVHLAVSGIVNALWDLWGKLEGKPLWRLLLDIDPEQLVEMLPFKYIEDELSREEALAILKENFAGRAERVKDIEENGFPAYTTAVGWSGYSEEKVRALAKENLAMGFRHFKVKVGLGKERDYERVKLIRDCVGEECTLMADANQVWSVAEAIENVNALSEFRLLWIEEPTAPDDAIGHKKIAEAIKPVGVATGEHAHNRILHKHFCALGAYQFCQTDPARVGGVSEILVICLMAKKFGIPVCLHAGGVGLCELGVHIAIFDYIAISASHEKRFFEYAGALHEHFEDPVIIRNGSYVAPTGLGYASDLRPASIAHYSYPHGTYWRKELQLAGGDFYRFKGNFVATLTPLTADGADVDTSQIAPYAALLPGQKISGVFVNGTSGESVSLTMEERMRVQEAWLKTEEVTSGKIDVITHVGGNSLSEIIELGRHAVRHGSKGLSIFAPTYY